MDLKRAMCLTNKWMTRRNATSNVNVTLTMTSSIIHMPLSLKQAYSPQLSHPIPFHLEFLLQSLLLFFLLPKNFFILYFFTKYLLAENLFVFCI